MLWFIWSWWIFWSRIVLWLSGVIWCVFILVLICWFLVWIGNLMVLFCLIFVLVLMVGMSDCWIGLWILGLWFWFLIILLLSWCWRWCDWMDVMLCCCCIIIVCLRMEFILVNCGGLVNWLIGFELKDVVVFFWLCFCWCCRLWGWRGDCDIFCVVFWESVFC